MLAALAIGGAIFGGITSFFKGHKKKKAQEAEYETRMEERRRQQELYDQASANLLENKRLYEQSWNLQSEHLTEQKDENLAELTTLSGITADNRDRVLGQNQSAMRDNSQLGAMQLSTLDVTSKNAVEQGTQRSALSGFRGTGTSRNLEKNISEASVFQREQATLQQSMSVKAAYNQTKNSFIASNQQIDSYKRNMDQVVASFDRASEQMDMQKKSQLAQFEQQATDLRTKAEWNDLDLEHLEDSYDGIRNKWANGVVLDMATGALSGAVNGFSLGAKLA